MNLNDFTVRTDLRPGDIGKIIAMHGEIYAGENGYGIEFEAYVAGGLAEYVSAFNPETCRSWILEYDDEIAGFILLMDRHPLAQLRYFIVKPQYRGIGAGNVLMKLFLDFCSKGGYKSAYLWTTSELHAAARLYIKFGFVLAEEKESSAFGKKVTEQRYVLKR